jgi:hypothetical protein
MMTGVGDSKSHQPGVFPAAHRYWSELASRVGPLSATRELITAVWEFVRDSTPSRLRQRFGDADYDWDFRVNTTSGAVGWRDRLLGTFHSAYQPTEPALFHEQIGVLFQRTRLNPENFTFVDLGSGKGRTLLMASDYPFRHIVGVELLPSLHHIAEQNIAQYKSDSQRCFSLESVCADANSYPLPEGPLVVYLFNPFSEAVLGQTLRDIEQTLHEHPRPISMVYHNPQHEGVFAEHSAFEKIAGTHQYSIFSTR